MKNLFFIPLLISTLCLKSQTKHIVFETGNIASVMEKAKRENKLIFIDAYTSWCGPCKDMAKHVFTNDTVANYFNSKFVNYKMDMEKGEGVEFAKKYQVNCYPSLLFIDAAGNIIHRGAGSMRVSEFIAFGENSLIPGKTFIEQKNNLEKEGVSENNILLYINLMGSACQDPSGKVNAYIKTVKENDLQNSTNWILIRDYVIKYDSREIIYFFKNIGNYENKFGKEVVEEKVVELGRNYFVKYIYSKEYDRPAFEKAKKDFTKLNWPHLNQILFLSDLNFNKRFDKSKYYSLAAINYQNYNNNNANALNNMAWSFYEDVTDLEQLRYAANMSKRACEINYEFANLDTYAAVLYKGENYLEAEKQVLAAIEKAKADKMNEDEYKETSELYKKIKAKLHSK